MRETVASLGAGVSLIAAGTFALLALTTVVAFSGWPLAPQVDAGPGLSVGNTPARVVQTVVARPLVVAAEGEPEQAGAPAAPRGRAAPQGREIAAGDRLQAAATSPDATTPAAPTPPAPSPEPRLGDPVREQSRTVSTAVRDSTDSLGTRVGGPVGTLLRSAGVGLAETLDSVGSVTAALLDEVGGGLLRR